MKKVTDKNQAHFDTVLPGVIAGHFSNKGANYTLDQDTANKLIQAAIMLADTAIAAGAKS